jgi:hypothetical protein
MTLREYDGSSHQQFQIEHDNSSGAFQISSVAYPREKLSIKPISTFGANLIHSSNDQERFRITNDGNGYYRIASKTDIYTCDNYGSTESRYQYTTYLDIFLDYSIGDPTYVPTDPYILWDFIEVVKDLDYSAFNLSETENKVFYYTPTASGNQSLTTISKYSTNISINDITSNYECTSSQSIDNYYFTSGHQYLISILFQSQNAVGEVIFCKSSDIVDYEDQLNNENPIVDRISLSMSAGEHKIISYTPSVNDNYKIEKWSNHNVTMQIYEMSSSKLNRIDNINGYSDYRIIKQLTTSTYYIHLYIESKTIGDVVDFSIIRPDPIINPLSKDLSLIPSVTKIFKINLSNTGIMMFYTKNKNVTLELYEYKNSDLVLICNNKTNLNTPLKQLIDSEKIYYLFVSSNVTQSNELFISYNVNSGLSDIKTIFEKNSNNEPIIYHESISTYGEFKFYKFTPLTTGNHTFSTKASSNGNTYMELYDSNGNLIAVDDDSGDSWSAKIKYNLTKGVSYFISIRYKTYYYIGQYDLQVYNSSANVWKVNWLQIQKSYVTMGDFTIINDIFIYSSGILKSVDSNNKILTFSSITWSWSVVNPSGQYEYQTLGMIIGKDYFGEAIDPNTGDTRYSFLLVEGNGILDTKAVTPNTWSYQCTYYDVSIEFSDEEWEYYCNAGIIRLEQI